MPGRPRFLVENFWNAASQFGDHTITANEAATRHDAFRVGDTRRESTWWTPTTSNSEAWIEVECDRPRAADTLVIDRGHNLDGDTVILECSDDDFSSTEEILNRTVPSNTSPNQRLSDGARNTEGAWAIHFDSRVATYWRLRIPAMGSGLKPEITGLYLGNSWQPVFHSATPFGWGDKARQFDQATSDTGWQGRVNTREPKTRAYPMKLSSFSEYSIARYHTDGLYWEGEVMWIWPDETQAEKGWLATAPAGEHGWEQGRDQWAFMQTDLRAREHQPVAD